MNQKIVKVAASNNGSGIVFSIHGSYDGVNFSETIKADTNLSPGNYLTVHISDFYAAIEIYAKSKTSGQPSQVLVQCVASSLPSSGSSSSSSNTITFNDTMEAIGFETLVVPTTEVITLSPATYMDASAALISVEGGSVRICWDGSTPTIAVGHLIPDGDIIYLESSADLRNFQAIASSTSSKLTATYSRQNLT